jgi:hypothetical protein
MRSGLSVPAPQHARRQGMATGCGVRPIRYSVPLLSSICWSERNGIPTNGKLCLNDAVMTSARAIGVCFEPGQAGPGVNPVTVQPIRRRDHRVCALFHWSFDVIFRVIVEAIARNVTDKHQKVVLVSRVFLTAREARSNPPGMSLFLLVLNSTLVYFTPGLLLSYRARLAKCASLARVRKERCMLPGKGPPEEEK